MSLRGRLFISICAVALACGSALSAQQPAAVAPPAVITNLGPATIPLAAPWRFHTGDDPAYAQPTFDDSAWQSIDPAQPWGDQGHWAYAGQAWYRLHIDWQPINTTPFGIFVPETACAYQLYWNGTLIGSTDAMPAPAMLPFSPIRVFPITDPKSGVLAIRCSTAPLDTTSAGNALGLNAVPQIGTLDAVRNLAAADNAVHFRKRFLLIAQLVLYLPLFFLALIVWLHHREQRLLFWVAAFLLASAVWILIDVSVFPWTLVYPTFEAFNGPTFHALVDISLWYLLIYLLDLNRNPAILRWTRWLACITLIGVLGDSVAFLLPHRDTHILLFELIDAGSTILFSTPAVYPLILIALAFRKPLEPARRFVAIAAFLADMLFVVAHTVEQGQRYTRWTLFDRITGPIFSIAGIDVTATAIISLLLAVAIGYAVYRYVVEQGQHQTALEQEFTNARTVQQVLVPEDIAPVPGFNIHSVYKPFGEVGGDFFQIIPIPSGGVIAVIGDVSGKGMPAAMTVALLVGTVRTLAFYERSPAQIMFAMNLRMFGRSQGGFTTCLILRADPDGTITTANAGHLSPYIAGRELPVESGLPLGLVKDATYDQATFHLAPNQQLTLLTDGVIESRSHLTGELFGFDRTAAISYQPAEAIAAAAQHFGQDDDITVLTLTRTP